jgi:hypothetical protein
MVGCGNLNRIDPDCHDQPQFSILNSVNPSPFIIEERSNVEFKLTVDAGCSQSNGSSLASS